LAALPLIGKLLEHGLSSIEKSGGRLATDRLGELDDLKKKGRITDEEYERYRAIILGQI
jgi:hypothetical protein